MPTEKQLANLRPWKKGECPNPGGRRKRPQSDANLALLLSPIPQFMLNAINRNGKLLEKGATWAQAISIGQARKAIAGSSECAKELRESVEGKAPARIELTEEKTVEVRVVFDPPPAKKRKPIDDVIDVPAIADTPEPEPQSNE
jgi:hypothetical protein